MPNRRRVYIDACCFIDMMKQSLDVALDRGRDEEVRFCKLLLEASRDKEIECMTSTLTLVECLHVGGNISDTAKTLLRGVLESGRFTSLISADPFIAERGRDLRWVHGVTGPRRGADYIHLASALETGCEEFITVDERIIGEANRLRLLGVRPTKPTQTALLSDDRRQMVIPGIVVSMPKKRGGRRPRAAKKP